MMTTSAFCTFRVGHLLFGVEVWRVQEVLRAQCTTPVPLARKIVHGLMNLRGQIVTTLNLRSRLNLSDSDGSDPAMNVVLRTTDGAVSLLVDEIGDVLEVEAALFEPTPDTLPETIRAAVQGIYKLPHRLLLVLNLSSLDPTAETGGREGLSGEVRTIL